MFNTKQIVVVASVIVLMGLLLSLDIKGLVKEEEANAGTASSAATGQSSALVNLESVSLASKSALTANLAQQITELEEQLKQAGGKEKLAIQKKLAEKWDDVNQPAPGAFYYQQIASTENTFDNWLKAGERFTQAYENSTDSVAQPVMVQHATTSYEKAVALNAKNLDAKAGLGMAYVNNVSGDPMKGIQLLLEVVKQDPTHIKANMSLGLFSIRSGQYDKAIGRFKTVIENKPTPEAWFYLASTYESLGRNGEAIVAYEKSKELAADPSLSAYVDKKVLELKK